MLTSTMEEPKITAIRNGVKQEFTRKMWDLMGTDKYGWELLEKAVPPVPKEVEAAIIYPPGSGVETGFPGFSKTANAAQEPTPGTNKQSKRKRK